MSDSPDSKSSSQTPFQDYSVFNIQESSITLPKKSEHCPVSTCSATTLESGCLKPSELVYSKPFDSVYSKPLHSPSSKPLECVSSKAMEFAYSKPSGSIKEGQIFDIPLGNIQYQIKPPKARNDLSLAKKVCLIRESESTGKSQRQLAAEFSISLGSVNNILRRKREYVDAFENNDCPYYQIAKLPRRLPVVQKKSDFDILNNLTIKWAEIAQMKNIHLSKGLIQEKAKEFATKLNMSNFSPTQAWFEGLQKHLNLPFPPSQENSDLTAKLYTVWMKMLPYLVQGYEPENVFTCGETALFYKGLPDKCFIEGGVCLGTHHNVSFEDHRFTLLFCCSATGEKLQPLVIGKTSHPVSGQSTASLPVVWRKQAKACMTSSLFAEWLQRLDLAMEHQGRRIALFMDMAPSHLSSLVLKNVSLKFYMDNSSSYLQPLQQGIIAAFKAMYRKRFLQAILARVDTREDSTTNPLTTITELDAIFWIKSAWDNVKSSLICNCFDAVGFSTSEASPDEGTSSLLSNLPELVEETGQALKFTPMLPELYLQFDSQVVCYVLEEEEWEKQLVAEVLGRPVVKSEPEDTYSISQNVDSECASHHQVCQTEALECLSKLKSFAVSDSNLLTKLYSLEETMLEGISAKRRRLKYRSMNILHVQ